MTAFAIGATLSGIGGIMGFGAAKDQERALKRSAAMSYDMAMRDVAQTGKDLQAQRVRDARAIRASTEDAGAAAAAMGGNISALRSVSNERALGAAELSRAANRDLYVLQRMRDNALIQRMNTLSQASAAGSAATASLINAGVNIASFAMAGGIGGGGGGGNMPRQYTSMPSLPSRGFSNSNYGFPGSTGLNLNTIGFNMPTYT